MEKIEKTLQELNNTNLYTILEIEKTDDVELIKKSYKKLIKKYHPDKNKDSNTVEKFDRIKIAYDLLKNEELKALYDSQLKSKEEKNIKKNKMNQKRKKFAEDLENREKDIIKNNQGENFDFKEKNKYAQYEDDFNKFFFENEIINEIPKKRTVEDKLNQYGIKIKWKKNMDVIFTKENLKSYFKEFGHIEDIIILENENKALILFSHDKAIREILNSTNNNINKLFKIKKYCKKEILKESQKPEQIKNKFIDTETLELLKNKRFMSNLDFIEQEKNKRFMSNLDFIEQEKNKTHKKNINDNKKQIKENNQQQNKSNTNGEINLNLDLESIEHLIFEKIKNSKK